MISPTDAQNRTGQPGAEVLPDAETLIDGWMRGNVLAAECPSRQVLQHLTSRWGTLVMVALSTGPHRFAELRRRVGGVSERMLSQTLKELEADGFVLRRAFDVVPPHVVYSLTPLGEGAALRVTDLVGWIESRLAEILGAGARAEIREEAGVR